MAHLSTVMCGSFKHYGSFEHSQLGSLIQWIYCHRSKSFRRIISGKLSEDLVTIMFCSPLPKSYDATAHQYLDGISVIVNYKLQDIIT